MHNYVALVLLLAFPAFAQLHRGNAGTTFSGLHNHWAVPIDGGKVWSWGMVHAGTSDCIAGGNHIFNDSVFTGSDSGADMQCGGATAPTIISTGMSISTGGSFADVLVNPDLSGGFTLASTFDPTTITSYRQCGLINLNGTTQQYSAFISYVSDGDFGFYYDLAGTIHRFSTAGSIISLNNWNTMIGRYTSASGSSAIVWRNNAIVTGSWTSGNGNSALPAVQGTTRLGNNSASSCVGTVGYVLAYNHAINASAEGFIYNAFYRAMQFRGVALP